MTQKTLPFETFFDAEALQRIFAGNGFPATRVMERAVAEFRNVAEAEFALGLVWAKAGTSILEACFGVAPPVVAAKERPSVEARAPERAEA